MQPPEFHQLSLSELSGVPIITLNRPDKLNALNSGLFLEIRTAVEWLDENAESRSVVLTGEGRGFIAGADLSEYAESGAEEFERFQELGETVYDAIRESSQVVVAAVNGFALGGGMEMVLACDVSFASDRSKFGLPEIGVALLPGGGGTAFLKSGFPRSVVKDLILSGRMLRAEEALQRGIVQYVTPADELMNNTVEYCAQLNSRSPEAVRAIKRILDPRSDEMTIRLRDERSALMELFLGENGQEGIKAFLEKRDPEYQVAAHD